MQVNRNQRDRLKARDTIRLFQHIGTSRVYLEIDAIASGDLSTLVEEPEFQTVGKKEERASKNKHRGRLK